jgi:hypothetical protein
MCNDFDQDFLLCLYVINNSRFNIFQVNEGTKVHQATREYPGMTDNVVATVISDLKVLLVTTVHLATKENLAVVELVEDLRVILVSPVILDPKETGDHKGYLANRELQVKYCTSFGF